MLVASHNTDSVELALKLMQEAELPKDAAGVYFGLVSGARARAVA